MKLLCVGSNVHRDVSVSRRLSEAVVERVRKGQARIELSPPDLAEEPYARVELAGFATASTHPVLTRFSKRSS
jgi:Acyl carrier protein phosphodiesterase